MGERDPNLNWATQNDWPCSKASSASLMACDARSTVSCDPSEVDDGPSVRQDVATFC